jgi:hypothetical protein
MTEGPTPPVQPVRATQLEDGELLVIGIGKEFIDADTALISDTWEEVTQ